MKSILNRAAIKPILLATLWIGASEFVRNQLLLASYWVDHYRNMGLEFPASPVNGIVWMIWSAVFASLIYILRDKFSQLETIALGWVIGFVLMWLVIGNLGVLPYTLLWFAIPLSVVEVYGAVWVVDKTQSKRH